jgi:TolA-binding protein
MNSKDKIIVLEETGCISRDQLLGYRDNTLPPAERHTVERHLVDCPLCTEALEGLALVTSPLVYDQLNENVRQLAAKGSNTSNQRQYWMAAASVSVIIMLAAYVYNEYRSVQHPTVVLQHEPVKLPGNTASTPDDASESAVTSSLNESAASTAINKTSEYNSVAAANEESADESITDVVAIAESSDAAKEEITAESPAEDNVTISANESLSVFSSPSSNQASYPQLKTPVVITEKDNTSKKSSAAESVSMSGNSGTRNTYIQNLKVIDYNLTGSDISTTDISTKSVESKYQNKQKKTADTSTGSTTTRRTSYLDLLENPVSQYKKKNYQQAIDGFNEILELHPGDQNAMFYKGLSLFHLQQHNEAIASLSGPGNDMNSTFYEEARFYMAKSYAAMENTAIAIDIFKSLANGSGFYSSKAKEELEKLK